MRPLLAALLAALPAAAVAADPPTVTPTQITEGRSRSLDGPGSQPPQSGNLDLTLKVAGLAARPVRRAGRWHLEEAADDKGTDLRPAAGSLAAAGNAELA